MFLIVLSSRSGINTTNFKSCCKCFSRSPIDVTREKRKTIPMTDLIMERYIFKNAFKDFLNELFEMVYQLDN